MKEDYRPDSMVVFDRAVSIPFQDIIAYGFLFDQEPGENDSLAEVIHSYIEYLSALICWIDEGGTISANGNFWHKDGNTYPFSIHGGYFAEKYIPYAYRKNPINYKIKFGCNPEFAKEDIKETFIIKNITAEQWT